jgi:RecB family exonuclease
LDRIDRVSVGRELLIDYKTGAAAPRSWFGDRPDDPQLPAYTLARTTRPAGLAFGIVKRGGCRMQGLGERGGLGEGIDAFDQAKFEDQAPDWARQLEAWSQRLTTLGAQFRSGEVRVNPKRYPQTCRHCGFASLCRVTELLDLNAQDEPDDE